MKLHNRYCHSAAHTPFPRLLLLDRYSFCFLRQRCLSVRLFSYIHLTSALLYSHAGRSDPRRAGKRLSLRFQPETKQKSSPSKDFVLLLAPYIFNLPTALSRIFCFNRGPERKHGRREFRRFVAAWLAQNLHTFEVPSLRNDNPNNSLNHELQQLLYSL